MWKQVGRCAAFVLSDVLLFLTELMVLNASFLQLSGSIHAEVVDQNRFLDGMVSAVYSRASRRDTGCIGF